MVEYGDVEAGLGLAGGPAVGGVLSVLVVIGYGRGWRGLGVLLLVLVELLVLKGAWRLKLAIYWLVLVVV